MPRYDNSLSAKPDTSDRKSTRKDSLDRSTRMIPVKTVVESRTKVIRKTTYEISEDTILYTRKDSTVNAHWRDEYSGLHTTMTVGLGMNRAAPPNIGTAKLDYPQNLTHGTALGVSLTINRPKGFIIGATVMEMLQTASSADFKIMSSRMRYIGGVLGGRMGSPTTSNAHFILLGGLGMASQRYLIRVAGKDSELASVRPCLMLRPEFEVSLVRNLQLICGIQAFLSYFNPEYNVRKSEDRYILNRTFADDGTPFFFYDAHLGLSYRLTR